MNRTALISALAILALAACDNKPADKPFVPATATATTATHTPIIPGSALPPGHPANRSGGSDVEQMEMATVVSTIDVPSFTYIEVKQGHDTRWLAARTIPLKKDAVIEFDSGSTVEEFKSKSLNRTFPAITFVNTVNVVKSN